MSENYFELIDIEFEKESGSKIENSIESIKKYNEWLKNKLFQKDSIILDKDVTYKNQIEILQKQALNKFKEIYGHIFTKNEKKLEEVNKNVYDKEIENISLKLKLKENGIEIDDHKNQNKTVSSNNTRAERRRLKRESEKIRKKHKKQSTNQNRKESLNKVKN